MESSYGFTKRERILFDIKSENEKLKKTRKANIRTETGRVQFMTNRARATSRTTNIATTRTRNDILMYSDSFRPRRLLFGASFYAFETWRG